MYSLSLVRTSSNIKKLQIKFKHKFLLKRRGVQFLNGILILFAGVKFTC